jgi:hypothetical protein
VLKEALDRENEKERQTTMFKMQEKSAIELQAKQVSILVASAINLQVYLEG